MFSLSSNHNKTSVLPKFEIFYPNKTRTFTPDLNKVQGRIELQLLNEASNIVSIDIGLKGESKTSQKIGNPNISSSTNRFSKLKSSKMESNEKSRLDIFFNESTNVFKSTPVTGVTFPEGYFLEYPFEFSFPTDKVFLPSSISLIDKDNADIKITYDIYIRIQYLTTGNKLSTSLDFSAHLNFQSNSLIDLKNSNIGSNNVLNKQIYQGKSKAYLPDPVFGGMISNRVNGAPAKFIKKNWNPDYSNGLIVKGDIELKINFVIPSLINLNSAIGSLPVNIEASAPGLTPSDFAYNGISTKLGYFEVQSLESSIIQSIKITVDKDSLPSYEKIITTEIIKERLPIKPNFDLKNFKYNEKSQTYSLNTTLAYFTKDETTTFFEKLTKTNPVMNNIQLNDFFSCENTLYILMNIESGHRKSGRESSSDSRRDNKSFKFTLPNIGLITTPIHSNKSKISYPVIAHHSAHLFDPNSPECEVTNVYNPGYFIQSQATMKSGAGGGATSGLALGLAGYM